MDALEAYRVLRQAHPTMTTRRGQRPAVSPLVLGALADKLGLEGATAEIHRLIPDAGLATRLVAKVTEARSA